MGDEVFAILQVLKIPECAEYAEAFARGQWTMAALKARAPPS